MSKKTGLNPKTHTLRIGALVVLFSFLINNTISLGEFATHPLNFPHSLSAKPLANVHSELRNLIGFKNENLASANRSEARNFRPSDLTFDGLTVKPYFSTDESARREIILSIIRDIYHEHHVVKQEHSPVSEAASWTVDLRRYHLDLGEGVLIEKLERYDLLDISDVKGIYTEDDAIYIASEHKLIIIDDLRLKTLFELLGGNESEMTLTLNPERFPMMTDEDWDLWSAQNDRYIMYKLDIDPVIIQTVRQSLKEIAIHDQKKPLTVLDLFGGDGRWVRHFHESLIANPVEGIKTEDIHYILIEKNQKLVQKAKVQLDGISAETKQHDLTSSLPLNQFFNQNHLKQPAIVISSGGLNYQVMAREEALSVAHQVYNLLPPDGIFIVTGYSASLLHSEDFTKIGFEVLNKSVPHYWKNRSPKQLYILRKPSNRSEVRAPTIEIAPSFDMQNSHVENFKLTENIFKGELHYKKFMDGEERLKNLPYLVPLKFAVLAMNEMILNALTAVTHESRNADAVVSVSVDSFEEGEVLKLTVDQPFIKDEDWSRLQNVVNQFKEKGLSYLKDVHGDGPRNLLAQASRGYGYLNIARLSEQTPTFLKYTWNNNGHLVTELWFSLKGNQNRSEVRTEKLSNFEEETLDYSFDLGVREGNPYPIVHFDGKPILYLKDDNTFLMRLSDPEVKSWDTSELNIFLRSLRQAIRNLPQFDQKFFWINKDRVHVELTYGPEYVNVIIDDIKRYSILRTDSDRIMMLNRNETFIRGEHLRVVKTIAAAPLFLDDTLRSEVSKLHSIDYFRKSPKELRASRSEARQESKTVKTLNEYRTTVRDWRNQYGVIDIYKWLFAPGEAYKDGYMLTEELDYTKASDAHAKNPNDLLPKIVRDSPSSFFPIHMEYTTMQKKNAQGQDEILKVLTVSFNQRSEARKTNADLYQDLNPAPSIASKDIAVIHNETQDVVNLFQNVNARAELRKFLNYSALTQQGEPIANVYDRRFIVEYVPLLGAGTFLDNVPVIVIATTRSELRQIDEVNQVLGPMNFHGQILRRILTAATPEAAAKLVRSKLHLAAVRFNAIDFRYAEMIKEVYSSFYNEVVVPSKESFNILASKVPGLLIAMERFKMGSERIMNSA